MNLQDVISIHINIHKVYGRHRQCKIAYVTYFKCIYEGHTPHREEHRSKCRQIILTLIYFHILSTPLCLAFHFFCLHFSLAHAAMCDTHDSDFRIHGCQKLMQNYFLICCTLWKFIGLHDKIVNDRIVILWATNCGMNWKIIRSLRIIKAQNK